MVPAFSWLSDKQRSSETGVWLTDPHTSKHLFTLSSSTDLKQLSACLGLLRTQTHWRGSAGGETESPTGRRQTKPCLTRAQCLWRPDNRLWRFSKLKWLRAERKDVNKHRQQSRWNVGCGDSFSTSVRTRFGRTSCFLSDIKAQKHTSAHTSAVQTKKTSWNFTHFL